MPGQARAAWPHPEMGHRPRAKAARRDRPVTRSEAARWGCLARATRLSPERRREIAAMGFQALVDQRFAGDRRAAIDWLTRKGLAALDAEYPAPLRKFVDPGPMPPAEPADQAEPEGPS